MKQKGFTLIELVVVIVILGILAATALPKFVDLSSDADAAAVKGVAGAISSGSSINYASRKLSATRGVQIINCSDVGGLLEGGITAGYSVTAAAIATNATVNCSVFKVGAATISATAPVIGIN